MMRDIRIPGLFERMYHPLYGTIKFDGTNQNGPLEFFEARTSEETDYLARMNNNMDLGNMIQHPRHFQATGFSVIPSYQADPYTVRQFIDSGHFHFCIGPKEYLKVPLDVVTYYNHLQGPDQVEPLSVSKLKISEPVYELPSQSWMDILPLQTIRMFLTFSEPVKPVKPFMVHGYIFGYFLREVY